ncbi:MAG: hypothetical protein U0411_06000 [Thermodesulfovibrionales bacterium]
MVPVGMGEHHGQVKAVFLEEPVSEAPYARPCVYDDDLIVLSDSEAGSISSVPKVFGARNRDEPLAPQHLTIMYCPFPQP